MGSLYRLPIIKERQPSVKNPMLQEQLNKLLCWEFVSPNLEKEKYFRYSCFQKKWLKITKDRKRTIKYLENWIEKTSITGQDMITHIVKALQDSANPELYLELVEACSVISDRNLNGLSTSEINESMSVAEELFRQSIVEESLFDHVIEN